MIELLCGGCGSRKPVLRDGVWVLTQIEQLPATHYICDHCDAPIPPGSLAVALSVWLLDGLQTEPVEWGSGYIIETEASE